MSAVTQPPVVPGSTMGIVANPMSGRDIRCLVAHGVVVTLADPATADRTVVVPIAPGVVAPIGVRAAGDLPAAVPCRVLG